MSTASFLLFASCALPAVAAAPSTANEKQVNELFQPVSGDQRPGAAVAVLRNGKVLLMKGYGLANVENGIAITPTTIFRIASVTKSFTSIAVLQLVESGKLRLDDPLAKFVPDFPGAGKIRIEHLLSHTAGVADFVPFEELLKRPLEFEPGTRINYSNNGYALLGRIIEKVTGKPWDECLRENIFGPLGMKNTGYDRSANLPGRATGYLLAQDGVYHADATQDAAGAYAGGGLYSTAEDMARWEQGLISGKLLSTAMLDRASTPRVLSDGRRAAYGFGWMTREYRGLREAGHGGDITGFNSYVARFPDEKLAVIVLSNVGMRPPGPLPDAGQLAHRIAEIWLGGRMSAPGVSVSVPIPTALLDTYVGRYKLDAPEVIVRNMGSDIAITREGERLVAEANGVKIPVDARSRTVFQAPGSPVELTFVCGAAPKCPKVVVTLMGLREFNALRVVE